MPSVKAQIGAADLNYSNCRGNLFLKLRAERSNFTAPEAEFH